MGKISEYERKRQENIERNEQMLAALRVLFAAQDLRSASKKPKSHKKHLKIPKEPKSTILRKSLRTRGILPEILESLENKGNSPVYPISKVISCSYDGFICSMDVEKEVFDMVYNSVNNLSAICTSPFSYQALYFAEGYGEMKMLDCRVGSVQNSYSLHEKNINSLDFSPQKPYLVLTSSDDGTARVFDLRKMKMSNNESLVTMQHKKKVYVLTFLQAETILQPQVVITVWDYGADLIQRMLLSHIATILYSISE
ncbi:hypothetical protein SUGI_0892590 [Cryptomeria japonica]|nr:hypothetical protein SUGI_0892590 [Cryptomeria japonica]